MPGSNEVAVGFVGLGLWGRKLLRAFASLSGVRTVALCDTDGIRLEAAATAHPAALRFRSFSDMICSSSVEAVVIATPPNEHALQSLAALDRGKHVFVEKPMALSSRDAARVVSAALAARSQLMVGHILRYHPAFLQFVEVTGSGVIGAVTSVSCVRSGTGPSAGAEQAWWTLAPHDVSALRALLGGDPLTISVQESAATPERDGAARATLRFPGGVIAKIVVAARAPRKTRTITVFGTSGVATFDDSVPVDKIRVQLRGTSPSSTQEYVPRTQSEEPLVAEARNFVDVVRGNGRAITDANEGAAVVAVLEAGIRSFRAGGAPMFLGLARPTCPQARDTIQ